jgi:hypothetical protein
MQPVDEAGALQLDCCRILSVTVCARCSEHAMRRLLSCKTSIRIVCNVSCLVQLSGQAVVSCCAEKSRSPERLGGQFRMTQVVEYNCRVRTLGSTARTHIVERSVELTRTIATCFHASQRPWGAAALLASLHLPFQHKDRGEAHYGRCMLVKSLASSYGTCRPINIVPQHIVPEAPGGTDTDVRTGLGAHTIYLLLCSHHHAQSLGACRQQIER